MDEYEPKSKIDKTYLNQPMSPVISPVISPPISPVISPVISPSQPSTDSVSTPKSTSVKTPTQGLKKPEGMSLSEEIQWNIDQSKKDKLGTKQFFDRKEKEKQEKQNNK